MIGRSGAVLLRADAASDPPRARGQAAVDRSAVEDVLVAASQLLAEVPEIAEFDVNPLLASPHGVLALDARVRVSAARPGGREHFALRHVAGVEAQPESTAGPGVAARNLART